MSILVNDVPQQFSAGPGLALGAAAASEFAGGPVTHMLMVMFGADGKRTVLKISDRKGVEELILTIAQTRDIVWPPSPKPEN